MPDFLSKSVRDRFLMVESELERIVEKHLPGEFANWEEQHTSWQGDVKTIDATSYDPRASACAWGLFVASDLGMEYFGRPDLVRDLKALNDLELSLARAQKSLQEMSIHARYELSRTSGKAQATIYDIPARLFLEPAIQDGRASIPDTKKSVQEGSAAPTRRNLRAAAVVAECRKVYEARTGRPAPKTARDRGQIYNEPALFVRFSRDVLDKFGINTQVSSALTALAKTQELDAEEPSNS